MRSARIAAAAFGAALAAASAPSGAAIEEGAWRVDADASRLAIVYLINDEAWRGVFHRFEGEGAFDPDAPETARMELVIDMESIDVGNLFVTAIAKTSDWLDVGRHPDARYSLTSLEPLGDGRYRSRGELSMRGRTHEIEGEISLATEGGGVSARGEATFDRSLYGVGTGFTSLFVDVGDPIAVSFELVARPTE